MASVWWENVIRVYIYQAFKAEEGEGKVETEKEDS